MPALALVLGPADLPAAELRACRLDGEVWPLGSGWVAVDSPVTVAARARAAGLDAPASLVAELGTAAWVWGARPFPPDRPTFCSPPGPRVRVPPARRLLVREVVLDPDELATVDGVRVTTPLRTGVDLARVEPTFDGATRSTVAALLRIAGADLGRCTAELDRRRNLPFKRRAVERLTALLAPPGQPAETR